MDITNLIEPTKDKQMSTEPRIYTAVFKDKEYTLSMKSFGKLIGRSVSFISARMSKAEVDGIKQTMQYAVDESERLISEGKVKIVDRSPARMSSGDSIRMKKEARFKLGIQSISDRFLYPVGVDVILKRERHLCQ